MKNFNTSNVINQQNLQWLPYCFYAYFNTSNVINQQKIEKLEKEVKFYFNTSNVINQLPKSAFMSKYPPISIHQMLLINLLISI